MSTVKKAFTGSLQELFSTCPLRAIIEATPDEMAILLVLQWLHFRRPGSASEIEGVDLLAAILCTPDALQADEEADKPVDQAKVKLRMSRRNLERGLARIRKRGWGKMVKGFQGKGRLVPNVLPIIFEEAEKALYNTATVAGLSFTTSPNRRSNTATVAAANIKREEEDQEPNISTADTAKPEQPPLTQKPKVSAAPSGEILGTFRTWWTAAFPGQKYVQAPGDGKLAQKLVAEGVTPKDMDGPLLAWQAKADDYTKEQGFPLWLFCRQFNALQMAAKKLAPKCTHPADAVEWAHHYRDGSKAGRCNLCGAPCTMLSDGKII